MIILAVQYEKHAEILRQYFEISAETTSLLTFLEEKYSASVADTIARGNLTTTAASSAARTQTCGQLATDNNDLTDQIVLEAEEELYFDEVVSLRLWNLLPIQEDAAFANSSRSVIESV
jgi:hypothetical protein